MLTPCLLYTSGHATVEDEQNGKIICERIIPFDELPKQLWLRFDTMEDLSLIHIYTRTDMTTILLMYIITMPS